MGKQSKACQINARSARDLWGRLPQIALRRLRELTDRYSLSIASGDLLFLGGRWYVTHSGLLRLARRNRCLGIRVQPVLEFCDSSAAHWAFKATVYRSRICRGFVGYGDADPYNVSLLVRGAEMRVAETRAVNRALRKAYGIGLCSIEETGSFPAAAEPAPLAKRIHHLADQNSSGNGRPRLRDRLSLLIRQHQLDPSLVKRYAADFCGTEALRDASRELVESFIHHLAEWATKDREGLLCKLNSYAQTEEVHS